MLFELLFIMINVSYVFFSEELLFVLCVLFTAKSIIYRRSVSLLFWDSKIVKPVLSFFFLSFFCFIFGYFNNGFSSATKDLWYFTKPIVYILTILNLCVVFKTRKVIFYTIMTSVACGVIYVYPILTSGYYSFANIDAIRDEFGTGNIIFPVSVLLCAMYKNYFNRSFIIVSVVLNIFFIVVSGSRIDLLYVLLIGVYYFAPFLFIRRNIVLLFIILLISAIPRAEISYGSNAERETFYEKITFTLNEIRPALIFFDDDIHKRWRGYETYMALTQYDYSNLYVLMLGNGFGKPIYIDFPKRARVSDEIHYELEWLHNGFVTIIFKSGFIGASIIFYIFFKLLNKCPDQQNYSNLVLLFIFISTFFTGGLLNKTGVYILIMPLVINFNMNFYQIRGCYDHK